MEPTYEKNSNGDLTETVQSTIVNEYSPFLLIQNMEVAEAALTTEEDRHAAAVASLTAILAEATAKLNKAIEYGVLTPEGEIWPEEE